LRKLFAALSLLLLLFAGCKPGGDSLSSSSQTVGKPETTSTTKFIASASPTQTETDIPTQTPDLRRYIVNAKSLDVWDAPENENKYLHLLTQLILGEKIILLDRQDDWAYIASVEQPSKKSELGYLGWVKADQVVQGWPAVPNYVVVMKPGAVIFSKPGENPLLTAYLDTRLEMISSQAEMVQVRFPDGREGWMRSIDIRITSNPDIPIQTDGLVSLAKSFTGIPYRWGGTTSASLDCSGLFYRVFHSYGITLYRDANDQATGGMPVDRESLTTGDLIFTSAVQGGPVVHVAMYLGNELILDATEYYGVYIRSIREFFYDNPWVTARRFLP
jgi:gamma-D-glutamyl-L-lysine dipeptidyl-peptidase